MKRRFCVSFLAAVLIVSFSFSAYAGGYVIGDADVLNISVWGNPQLTAEVPVRPDGMISVPLIGDVRAAGRTPQDLKDYLQKEYANFVKSPTVSVLVTQVNSFKVYVIGGGIDNTSMQGARQAGGATGVVTLKKDTTVLQLLAQLGSLKNADLNDSYILRDGKKLGNDLYRLVYKGDISQNIELKPNDVIFIPDNFKQRIIVVGAVKTPTVLPYREGLTALDAIVSAGGFTDFASRNSVVVMRKDGDRIKHIEVKLKDVINGDLSKNIVLQPGDVISVETGLF